MAGVAVSVTEAPGVRPAVQVVSHERPAGSVAIVPLPEPAFVSVNCGLVENDAAHVRSPVPMVTVVVGDVPAPQLPLQPKNVCPALGAAVSVTDVPG